MLEPRRVCQYEGFSVTKMPIFPASAASWAMSLSRTVTREKHDLTTV